MIVSAVLNLIVGAMDVPGGCLSTNILGPGEKMRVEEMIFESGVPFTILQPAPYLGGNPIVAIDTATDHNGVIDPDHGGPGIGAGSFCGTQPRTGSSTTR